MDANARGKAMRVVRRSMFGLATAWLVAPIATTEASAMRGGASAWAQASRGLSTFDATPPLPGRWESFLAGGESTWAVWQPPPFTQPVRAALMTLVNGDPAVAAASPLVEYFVWRRNLNPGRFDRYHPFIGPRLPQGLIPPPPIKPPVIPEIPNPPVPPPPIPLVPPTVPEPSALLVIAAGAAGALVARRRSKYRSA